MGTLLLLLCSCSSTCCTGWCQNQIPDYSLSMEPYAFPQVDFSERGPLSAPPSAPGRSTLVGPKQRSLHQNSPDCHEDQCDLDLCLSLCPQIYHIGVVAWICILWVQIIEQKSNQHDIDNLKEHAIIQSSCGCVSRGEE